MNHAITVGGLLFSVGFVGGILTMLGGMASAFANMMADAAGDNGKGGCIALVVGFVLAFGCAIGLIT